MRLISYIILVTACFVSIVSNAQTNDSEPEFLLFEEVDVPNSEESNSSARVRPSRNETNSSSPDFTLSGTSQIGNSHHVTLKHSSGNSVRVKVAKESIIQVPGYLAYSIIDFRPGLVNLRLPESSSCVEFVALGVSCNSADNIAILTLANGDPLPPSANQSSALRNTEAQEEDSGEITNEEPANPFTAIREQREANGGAPGGNNGRFTPRRISPDDVPAGMRVVSTPFGDRLVEE